MAQLASDLATWPHKPVEAGSGLQGLWNAFIGIAGRALTNLGYVVFSVASQVNVQADLAKELAGKYGWFIHGNLTLPFVLKLGEIGKATGNRRTAVAAAFIDYYRSDNWAEFRRMTIDWNRISALEPRRRRVLRDLSNTLMFHDPPRYNAANVVIPAVIAQIDGLLARFAAETLNLTFNTLGYNERKALATAFASNIDSHFGFEEAAVDLIFNVLYATAYYRMVPEGGRMLSRHKIIHGEALGYGTLANALRLFLMLDFVIRVIQRYHDEKLADTPSSNPNASNPSPLGLEDVGLRSAVEGLQMLPDDEKNK